MQRSVVLGWPQSGWVRLRWLTLGLGLAALGGCPGRPIPPVPGLGDAGPGPGTEDAGSDPEDAGPLADAGRTDAGPSDPGPTDAGTEESDGGPRVADAGSPLDAGLPPADAGLPDGGPLLADAGPLAPQPDFSLHDVNPTSSRYGQAVSPRDYLEKVSGWYFGHAT